MVGQPEKHITENESELESNLVWMCSRKTVKTQHSNARLQDGEKIILSMDTILKSPSRTH